MASTPPTAVLGGRIVRGARIAAGGVATVYRATDERRGEVALKMVDVSDLPPRAGTALRFIAEARAQARLDHPHLVPVYDAGREGSWLWYTMELLSGSLRDVISRGAPVPPLKAARWTFEALAALHSVHAGRLVHRDVKPGNLLLDATGRVKLGDFGIARHPDGSVDFRTMSGAGMGSAGYIAPEQGSNASAVDRRADLYAVAAVLYELMTAQRPGRLPFAEIEPGVLEPLPEEFRPFVLRGVASVPERRHKTARDMADDLVQVTDAWSRRHGQPAQAAAWMWELSASRGLLERLRRFAEVLSRGPA